MVTQTNEQALEACIEKALTGTCREQLKLDGVGVSEANDRFRGGHLYWLGESGDFDREFEVDRRHFWRFLETTQADELEKLTNRPQWKRLILERLNRKIQKEGIVHVLKSGLRIDNAHFTLFYSQPYNAINPEVARRFAQNIFSVTRQVAYSTSNPLKTIDMVIFLNGIAVATLELKNAWTGQSTYHAMKQYREDRDPNEVLLQFGRCLVHFAVDTDDVYMTTRLDGKQTNFLPFNKGWNHGKGNPPGDGHKTSYLWQDILSRQSLAAIIEHFTKLVGEKGNDPLKKKRLYFPRYHQLEVVRNLIVDVRDRGVGRTYLIQHSAGSGKSNSITWAAYQLIEVYPENGDRPIFDSVVVVTDRKVLDKQLRNTIRQFSEVKNIVAPAMNSQELKQALESGKKIIITTIQKFPFIVDGIDDLSDKRFAVIIDEAHSSQSGASADTLNRTLGADEDEVQDAILENFLEQVVGPKKLKGQARAMVVTRNIESAIRYFFAIRKAIKDQPFKAIVAFSGKSVVDGVEYTEDTLNGFPAKDIEEKFDSDDYRLLVVANKYLTGFDQPKLSTMYIDKKLQGVLAVQAISRMNRCCHALNKRKEDMFVLDFFNSTDDIQEAFDPFYTSTSLSQATDVNVLHDIQEKLAAVGVYEWEEVETFCTLYFSDAEAERLSPIIDRCAGRFDHELELEDEGKADFKIKAKQFVKIYAQLACIMPFDNIEWEKLHWFLKFLIPKLKVKDRNQDTLDALLESVDLSTYGLERVKLKQPIALDAGDSELDPQNPNVRGAYGGDDPKDPLDEIIRAFNERWFSGWDATPAEQRIKFINIAHHVLKHPNYQTQVVDNPDEQNSRIALEKMIEQAVNQERKRELELYKRYLDPEFKRAFDATIIRILAAPDVSNRIGL